MKNILRFLFVTILFSVFLSGGLFVWQYKEHYFLENQQTSYSFTDKYDLVEISGIENTLPVLPDISKYTSEALKQKIPDFSETDIKVQLLQEAIPHIRSKIPYFGDKQDRIDPLAIAILSGVASLDDLVKEVDDVELIEKGEDKNFTLHVPLSVRRDATLIIQEGETLLLSSNEGVMLPILGNLYIVGATIIGWDTAQDQPAYYTRPEEFRPYLAAWCGAKLNITDSYLGHLGYAHPKSYGVSYSSYCEDDEYTNGTRKGGTGWIVNSRFEQLYFGFYSYEVEGAVIVGNQYKDNIVYGIDPHDRSSNLIIADNVVSDTREKHGIIVSRDVNDSFIFNNLSENNAQSGVMIDRNSQRNTVMDNVSRHNGRDGLVFYESPNNISYRNILTDNGDSGLRVRNSWNIKSQEDVINNNENHAVQLYTQDLGGRDVERDPYKKKAEMSLNKPEIIGNKEGVFKLEKFNRFEVVNPLLYKISSEIFSGDIKGIEQNIFEDKAGVFLQSKVPN